ncbi:hypothetical protein [Argonema antarcticum]|uniref:hypothetical protein n=1 Tax=Argonema antarcticum TaxID=2942763 RepID=UPI002012A90D|nr:hypothetical protein [Argonema antarcticum]MCL1474362.1 hypothetical protein [Argonema antarcticum A004/B2]
MKVLPPDPQIWGARGAIALLNRATGFANTSILVNNTRDRIRSNLGAEKVKHIDSLLLPVYSFP